MTGRGAGEKGSRGAEERRRDAGFFSPPRPRSPAPLRSLLPPAAVAIIAVWLYRRALTFAFFNDDPTGHFAWMEGRALWQFFSSSAEYGYYRPVVFSVLRLFEVLFGNDTWPHHPVADHALLVLLHGANAALVWALARRLSGRDAYAWPAALVFAFVPFSYEAVAYVASLTHPLVVFWVLAALLLYDRGRRAGEQGSRGAGEPVAQAVELVEAQHAPTRDRWWLIASGMAMTLALLTHENGLLTLPALVGLDWVVRPRDTWRQRARALWPFAVPPLLFLALWLAVPKNSDQGLNSLADVGRNIVPFLQTLVYPLLPLLKLDSGDVGGLALLAFGVVALFGFLAWRSGALRLWAFALGWIVLASLPALLFLTPAYVYGSPRLSYLPAVGVGLLWALTVTVVSGQWSVDSAQWTVNSGQWSGDRSRLKVGGRWSAVRFILLATYVLALVLPPLPFIGCQLDFYAETSRLAREMVNASAAASDGNRVVYVNAPFFFSSYAGRPDGCPNPYPWTPVGGVLVPPYAAARDFVRFNGGPELDAAGVTFTGYRPGWRAFGPEIDGEDLRALTAEDSVFVFDLLSGSFVDLAAIWRPGAGLSDSPPATFGDELQLSEASFTKNDDWLDVALDWRVIRAPAMPLAAFVHVYDAAGALVAQSDGPPGSAFAPQDLWRPGDGLADRRRVDLTALPPGSYTVAVGVYNPLDGVRLEAIADGGALPDNLFIIGRVER